jgi:hypothetical protein
MTKNIEEEFIKDLYIMKSSYFEAEERIKSQNKYKLNFVRILSFFTFICSLIIIINSNIPYTKYFLSFTIVSSVYVFIFLSIDNDKEDSNIFKVSGNKIIKLIKNLESKNIDLVIAQNKYQDIIDYTPNRADTDRHIAELDYDKKGKNREEKDSLEKKKCIKKCGYKSKLIFFTWICPIFIISSATLLLGKFIV